MPGVKALAHVCLASPDLGASEAFYCRGLGLEKHFEFHRDGEVVGFYLKVTEGSYIEIFRQDQVGCEGPCAIKHLCFEVEDIDGLAAHMRSLGHEVSEKKKGCDGSWQAWTTDPGGASVEFHQYTDASSQRTRADCRFD